MGLNSGRTALVALVALAAGCNVANPCPSRALTDCGGLCVDTSGNVQHCGSCQNACADGLFCVQSTCVASGVGAACASRSGGAFVTIEVCDETVKVWSTSAAFVDQAAALLAAPALAVRFPVFDLRAGSDCDAQWSWSVDPSTAFLGTAAPPRCDACPSQVEAAVSFWVSDMKQWCPLDVRVLAVERR
jgi:hypothetical protein